MSHNAAATGSSQRSAAGNRFGRRRGDTGTRGITPSCLSLTAAVAPDEVVLRLPHSSLETKVPHIDVRQPCLATVLTQLIAAPSNPGRCRRELCQRCFGLPLRLWATVGREVIGAEGPMSQEARPNLHPLKCGLQASGVHRRQFEALDEELLGFLHTYLGGLLDMWVHELGQEYSIDRILIKGVELGKHPAKDRPHNIGRQPWNSLRLEESQSQGGLAHPGRATNEIENAARHDTILSTPAPRGLESVRI
jgi:hypothetical protein